MSDGAAPRGSGAALLDATMAFVTRFVAFPQRAAAIAVGLWIIHTHGFEHATATPYLDVHSPAPRCGKSTLFEVLAMLVSKPISGSNMSPAVIYRLIDSEHPTLLMDEMDAQMRSDREKASAIQSILNSGYKGGAASLVWRCEAPTFKPVPFETFCPKAFAGIGAGNLHQTTQDRCIPILLERKFATETVERLRTSRFAAEAEQLREEIIAWVESVRGQLATCDPDLPDELDDRAQEIWEPLLAIADAADGAWPERARAAAIELHTQEDLDDLPLGVLLLKDIQTVFDDAGVVTLGTQEVCNALGRLEQSPWGNWTTHGVRTGLSPRALARFLRDYGIRPRTVRLGGEEDKPTRKGYRRDWFETAWTRYLPEPIDEHGDD